MKKVNYDDIKSIVTDGYGRRLVVNIFKETARTDVKFEPPFSLKEWKRIYLEVADPTEYKTAQYLIGDWDHYQEIRNHPKHKETFDAWAKELEIALRSEAVVNMIEHAKRPGGAVAAKWLAEGAYGGSKRTKAARQAEEEIKEEVASRVSADVERLGLRVVSGGK